MTKALLAVTALLVLTGCALQRSLENAARKADQTIDQTQALLAQVGSDYRATVRKHDTDRDGTLSLTEIALGLAGLLGLGGAKVASSTAKRNAASDQRKAEIEKQEAVTAAKLDLLIAGVAKPKTDGVS